MDFRIKNIIQSALSSIPGGARLNYLLQKHISKTVPASDNDFITKMKQVELHISNYKRYASNKPSEPLYMEFGAGWELMMPIAFAAQGFKVLCLDIRRLASTELVNHTLSKFNRLGNQIPFNYSLPASISSFSQLETQLSFQYIAPGDARATKLPEESIDFISTTSTLEHIPPKDLQAILQESYRILSPGGVASMLIDYKDHYSYFDSSISHYHFLQYSEKQWSRYNPSLHYQNRLRHSQYLAMCQKCGFEIVRNVPYPPTPSDIHILNKMSLDSQFDSFDIEDLGTLGSELVLRKSSKSESS